MSLSSYLNLPTLGLLIYREYFEKSIFFEKFGLSPSRPEKIWDPLEQASENFRDPLEHENFWRVAVPGRKMLVKGKSNYGVLVNILRCRQPSLIKGGGCSEPSSITQ